MDFCLFKLYFTLPAKKKKLKKLPNTYFLDSAVNWTLYIEPLEIKWYQLVLTLARTFSKEAGLTREKQIKKTSYKASWYKLAQQSNRYKI